jgi:hypothetical protein
MGDSTTVKAASSIRRSRDILWSDHQRYEDALRLLD